MKARGKRSRTARLMVVIAAVVVLTAVLAAPALAAAPTEWTSVSPASKTITYGQGVIITGTLMSNGAYVGGLWVDFAQATTSSGSYKVMYKVTSPTEPYATGVGEYAIAVIPMQTTYYRFEWEGDADYLAAAQPSDVVPVQVKPSLGKPTCPSSAKAGKKFTVSGSVKPGQGVGPAVKIKTYRKKNGEWVFYKDYSAKVSDTQYSASIKPNHTGKYKFKAVTASSASYAAGESSYSNVTTVK
jgi:hypothetical protein